MSLNHLSSGRDRKTLTAFACLRSRPKAQGGAVSERDSESTRESLALSCRQVLRELLAVVAMSRVLLTVVSVSKAQMRNAQGD